MPEISMDHWHVWFEQRQKARTWNESDVLDYLRHGAGYRLKGTLRLLQILVNSAVQPVRSYEIFRRRAHPDTRSSDTFFLLRTKWDRVREYRGPDRVRLQNLPPQLDFQLREVDAALVDGVLAAFKVTIPAWLPEGGPNGLEGTLYELALGHSPMLSVRYAWWQRPPEDWAPLDQALQVALETFESLFASG